MSTRYTSNENFNGGKVEGSVIEYEFKDKNSSCTVVFVGLFLVIAIALFILAHI